jgi:hypothetical protein
MYTMLFKRCMNEEDENGGETEDDNEEIKRKYKVI